MAMAVKHDGTGDRVSSQWRDGEVDSDPFGLPAYVAIPAQYWPSRAVGFIRYATIYRDEISVHDSSPILGVRSWWEPVNAYDGVVMRLAYRDRGRTEPVIIIELRHPVATRSVIVHVSFDGSDAAARWHAWAANLGLPELIEDREGDLSDAQHRLGQLITSDPQPHRGASALTMRRPLAFGFTGRGRHWSERLTSGMRPRAY